MQAVTLKNGAVEAGVIVITTMMTLEQVMKTDRITFYEAVRIARRPAHKPFGDTGKKLQDLALLDQNGKMHESIRNVVLSAVTGNDLDMQLGSPVAA